ncbi:MAG: SDR family oxidoreductase [Deltaproteobacteria bacterium]|nr:SDR family oxidoreductase [Deltaproteobacteria bacterium]
MRLENQTVFVTGAGSGIGRATALLASREGAAVAGVDIDEKGLKETVALVEEEGGRIDSSVCDITDPESVHEAVARCVSAFDGLQTVYNVAGIGAMRHTAELSLEEWNRVLGVNLTGTFLVSQAALPHLLANEESAIVNVASVAGLNGQAYGAAYCASKWGVVGLSKAMAVEFVKQGLRVNCVCPAGVKTPLIAHFLPPEGADPQLLSRLGLVPKFTEPEEVAEALVYLSSAAARSISGIAMAMDFGNSAT